MDKTIKILIVDDSASTLNMEVKMLKELGFENIVEASDGQVAMDTLNRMTDIQVVITDWNMPNKSGFELLQWIRANEQFKHIPVIMATAQGEKKKILMAINAGATNYIVKPVDKTELGNVLQRTFSKSKINATKQPKQAPIPQKTQTGKARLQVAHIQITDHLILGVLKHLIQNKTFEPKYFELETKCMPGWNPLQKQLERGDINAAFTLAPIAMDLFSFQIPIKLVLFAHKNGSICVKRSDENHPILTMNALREGFINKDFLIPHLLSIHHMITHMLMKQLDLNPGLPGENDHLNVYFEVVPPINMPELMNQNTNIGGYMVAEPLGSKAIKAGVSDLAFLSSDIWQFHPCCVVAIRDDFIQHHTDAVYEFVDMLVKSGLYIQEHPKESADIAVNFLDPNKKLGLESQLIQPILDNPQGLKTNDLYPMIDQLDNIQRYMNTNMGIGTLIDLEKFIDTRFVDQAYASQNAMPRMATVYHVEEFLSKLAKQSTPEVSESKTMTDSQPEPSTESIEISDHQALTSDTDTQVSDSEAIILEDIMLDEDELGLADNLEVLDTPFTTIVSCDDDVALNSTVYFGVDLPLGDIGEVKATVLDCHPIDDDMYRVQLNIIALDDRYVQALMGLLKGEITESKEETNQPLWALGLKQSNGAFATLINSPAGVLTGDQLAKIAEVTKQGAGLAKLTHAQRVILLLNADQINTIEQEMATVDLRVGVLHSGIRNIRACCGALCQFSQGTDAISLAVEMDKKLFGRPMKFDIKIAISDCLRNCLESYCVDIGMIGSGGKYAIFVGGAASSVHIRAQKVVDQISQDQVIPMVENILTWYEKNALDNERLHKTLARIGQDSLTQISTDPFTQASQLFQDFDLGFDMAKNLSKALARCHGVKQMKQDLNIT